MCQGSEYGSVVYVQELYRVLNMSEYGSIIRLNNAWISDIYPSSFTNVRFGTKFEFLNVRFHKKNN